jgi:hypothetical protein
VRQQIAWDLGPTSPSVAVRADREIRIADLVLFAAVPFAVVPIPTFGVPINELAMVLACLVAVPRVAKVTVPAWFTILLMLVAVELAISTILNELDAWRRLAHLGLFVALGLLLAFNRISARSAALGLGIGLVSVIGLAMVGIGGNYYPGRLTGFFGDPNVAAFYLAVLSPLVIGFVQPPRMRLIFMCVLPLGLFLTYSRTGLLAAAVALLWVLIGRRLGIVGGAIFVVGLVFLVGNLPDDVRLYGPFSDRSGSDALRERILEAERASIADAPSYGHGPGTSLVTVSQNQFFFHNSYLATRNEGGWLLLAIILLLFGACLVTLVGGALHHHRESMWSQASLISALIMAINLGEVFLELPTVIALGFAIAAWRIAPQLEANPTAVLAS